MKRFSPREFLFLCAPIVFVGAGFVAVRLLNPPRDPDAVIALSVTSAPNPIGVPSRLHEATSFGWKAKAQGGPQDEIQLLYTQKLVVSGDGRSQILFQEPAVPATPNASGIQISTINEITQLASQEESQSRSVSYESLPIWTERLEWSGDFVAFPLQPGVKNASGVGIPSTFSTLACIKGAAHVSKNFPVKFDSQKVAGFQELKLEKVLPIDVEYGVDTCVTTQFRSNPRRIYARLVAFDGTTKRQLWSNLKQMDKSYWITGTTGTNSYVQTTSELFKLCDVPAHWGELTYIVDAAFNPNPGRIGDKKSVSLAEIERLKKAGWWAYSKRLTVRKMGAKIVAPAYSKTPNTQFLGAQTSISKAAWVITVRLKYNGPTKSDEALDVSSASFFDSKGNYVNFSRISSNVIKSTKPREYIATITVPTQALGSPRPLTMKVTIADKRAMPLHFQTEL